MRCGRSGAGRLDKWDPLSLIILRVADRSCRGTGHLGVDGLKARLRPHLPLPRSPECLPPGPRETFLRGARVGAGRHLGTWGFGVRRAQIGGFPDGSEVLDGWMFATSVATEQPCARAPCSASARGQDSPPSPLSPIFAADQSERDQLRRRRYAFDEQLFPLRRDDWRGMACRPCQVFVRSVAAHGCLTRTSLTVVYRVTSSFGDTCGVRPRSSLKR